MVTTTNFTNKKNTAYFNVETQKLPTAQIALRLLRKNSGPSKFITQSVQEA